MDTYRKMQVAHFKHDGREDIAKAHLGPIQAHQDYPYAEHALAKVSDPANTVALDFGCGPGRMILQLAPRLKRVDGCDISEGQIIVARRWLAHLDSRLYVTDGANLGDAPSAEYDLVYCTISFQHVARHDIRMLLLAEMFRVLKPGGRLALQCTWTDKPQRQSMWRDNRDDITTTNGQDGGMADFTMTPTTWPQAIEDLTGLGFTNIEYTITPPPHEWPADWMWLYAVKP